jgi:GT2 family glycosyltransferase
MKILIGCPTYERYNYCVDLWVKRIKEIQEYSKEHQIDYLLADNSPTDAFYKELEEKKVNVVKAPYFPDVRKRVIYSRNMIREKFLNENYDFFFSLEQDVIPPKDIIEKLLKHNKEIVSAYYSKLVKVGLKDNETGEIKNAIIELALIWMQNEGEKIRRANPQEVLNKGLIKVGGYGIGCVLIKREVLEKIKFEYKPDKKAFDDMFFCDDAQKAGYDLFLDSDVRVSHLNKSWDRENV